MHEIARPPLRVLDLACGGGRVRVAVARRLPSREIHYTGIDNGRLRLDSVESVLRAFPQLARAGDPDTESAQVAQTGDLLRYRLKERYIRTDLELHDPGRLATQLRSLLGSERFDEIHVHLLQPGKHGWQAVGPRVLSALARYLRPGARLYHLFQHSSPFFDFKPERTRPSRVGGGCPAPGSPADVIGRNLARFEEGASKGGLALEKCGHRWGWLRTSGEGGAAGEWHNIWVTRRFTGSDPDPRTAETHQRLAEEYSGFSRFATHFVILSRRRKKPASAARQGRPGG